jgi:hypothetical protein
VHADGTEERAQKRAGAAVPMLAVLAGADLDSCGAVVRAKRWSQFIFFRPPIGESEPAHLTKNTFTTAPDKTGHMIVSQMLAH